MENQNRELLVLAGLLKESHDYEKDHDVQHYMFFNNLKTIKDRVDHMLSLDPKKVDEMLKNGHDWANDHIATSKDDVEEVYNWLTAEMR
jgi:hypothetical protein